MRNELKPFIRDFSKELREENAAVFAGAGLSVPSGVVDWKGLLKELADDLGLDVNQESDLVRLAQFHVNDKAGNRDSITTAILEKFARTLVPNENHRKLSALPIPTYWTTNYDKLIENSLEAAGKVVDVKYETEQLTQTKPRRDAVVYKMHGDIDHPTKAVITREDYERYHKTRKEFLRALSGDLVSKRFLFIGCGFTDPNLDYVLARISAEWTRHQRRHFFFVRKPVKWNAEPDDAFNYRKLREELFAQDLKRFALDPVWLDTYGEIPEVLDELRRIYRQDTAFISGAAHEYTHPWGEDAALEFAKALAMNLVKEELRVVSGFGLGIGSAIIAGALEQVLMHQKRPLRDQLVTRPFPQAAGGMDPATIRALWTEYRGQMLSQSGIAVFMFGNKLDKSKGTVVPSDGMREEFDIAKREGLLLVPVGATGYVAEELWKEVKGDFRTLYPGVSADTESAFDAMNDSSLGWQDLLVATMNFINLVRRP